MKTVFFGTPNFVDPVLQKLEEISDLVLKVRNPQVIDENFLSEIRKLNPDLLVVAAYGQILPPEIIKFPNVNIHPSLLPKYRGPSPIQTAILNGDKKTGVSFIKMDEEVDHGPIIYQVESEILDNDTFESLAKRLFKEAADNLEKAIDKLSDAKQQDHGAATFTDHLTRENGLIDLKNAPEQSLLDRMIRAYYPWPGVWFRANLNGRDVVVKLLPENMIQVEGKRPMKLNDFKNGYEKGEEILRTLNLG